MKTDYKHFWYIACESKDLDTSVPLSAQILGEWLACFRGRDGKPVALRDCCLHRAGRLSRGSVRAGILSCPYHGWCYNEHGEVISIPSEGGEEAARRRGLAMAPFETCEQDGYIYVRLEKGERDEQPFGMSHFGETPWRNIRLRNSFRNNVTNCVENFIDIPHTAYVHQGVFRSERSEPIQASIVRESGRVMVSYRNETDNLGSFSWFLNPSGREIEHTDTFYMPNITQVTYTIGPRVTYVITSQSIPVDDDTTTVYTDITYRLGMWTRLAAPIVRRQAQKVIDQDIEELDCQMEVIEKYGARFLDSPSDLIHTYVAQIRDAIDQGKDPLELPDRSSEVSFWI